MLPELTDEYFEYLFRKYSTSVYKITWNILKNEADAQDMLQDTFVKFHRYYESRRRDFHGEAHLARWLSTIAKNTSLNLCRGKKETLEFKEELYKGLQIDPASVVEQRELVNLLDQAIDRLSVEQAEAIRLRHYAGVDPKEISNLLGVPLQTVYSRLAHGTKKLKKLYERLVNPNE